MFSKTGFFLLQGVVRRGRVSGDFCSMIFIMKMIKGGLKTHRKPFLEDKK